MSIDQYPAMDAKRTEDGARVDIGAAALLHHNDDLLFPEFAGNDVSAMFSGIKFVSKAFDGATCDDFLTTTAQSALGELSHGRALVTLSIGGNDLLDAHRRSARGDRQTLMTVVQRRSLITIESLAPSVIPYPIACLFSPRYMIQPMAQAFCLLLPIV
ncbi:MAG: hypothetical protein IPP57_22755 [Candidatus Obscuribacter sp.]|nr:hypothetical protein [Candidatus Obscuribacter sp.]